MDAAGEFPDWEVVSNPDDPVISNSSDSNMPGSMDGFERDSEGTIQFDYFSVDSNPNHLTVADDCASSVQSDNPSWIDPGAESGNHCVGNGENWSDSISERSDDHKVGEFEVNSEVGDVKNVKLGDVGVDGIGAESEVAIGDKVNFVLDDEPGNNEIVAAKSYGEEGRKSGGNMVWWKQLPLDFFKYCLFRGASPVWSISVAVAMMGFVLLGRRLYKMKNKSRSLQLNFTVDDKVRLFCHVVLSVMLLGCHAFKLVEIFDNRF